MHQGRESRRDVISSSARALIVTTAVKRPTMLSSAGGLCALQSSTTGVYPSGRALLNASLSTHTIGGEPGGGEQGEGLGVHAGWGLTESMGEDVMPLTTAAAVARAMQARADHMTVVQRR